MKQVPINEKEKKTTHVHRLESAVLLSYMLTATYRSYKDKYHFYIEPTSAGDKMASCISVIGRGQVFQLLKSSWAIFYRRREFAASALARLHYTKL